MLFSKNFFNTLDQAKKGKLKELLEELPGNVNKNALFSSDNG